MILQNPIRVIQRKQVCKTYGISRTWDYQLRKRVLQEQEETGSISLNSLTSRSSRPLTIHTKLIPPVLEESESFLIALYEKHHHPGYQKFFLYCKQEKWSGWKWIVSERDI